MNNLRSNVNEIINEFYYNHHDHDVFREALIKEMINQRVSGFMEAKNTVLDGLEHFYKMNRGKRELDLHYFYSFVKGLVVKVKEEKDV